MEKLADYIESRSSLRNKILTAFIYPVIVTLVSIVIVIFLLSYVVPQVVGAFNQAHQALPLLTRLMLSASGLVRDRSEERRVGKECVSTCRSRWAPDR